MCNNFPTPVGKHTVTHTSVFNNVPTPVGMHTVMHTSAVLIRQSDSYSPTFGDFNNEVCHVMNVNLAENQY